MRGLWGACNNPPQPPHTGEAEMMIAWHTLLIPNNFYTIQVYDQTRACKFVASQGGILKFLHHWRFQMYNDASASSIAERGRVSDNDDLIQVWYIAPQHLASVVPMGREK